MIKRKWLSNLMFCIQICCNFVEISLKRMKMRHTLIDYKTDTSVKVYAAIVYL